MATMVSPGPVRPASASASPAPAGRPGGYDEATAQREAYYFQRLADRLAGIGLVGLAACAWLLRDELASFASWKGAILFLGAFCLGTFMAVVIVRTLVGRLFLRPTARLIDVAERIADGDFTAQVQVASSRGAAARLSRAMARMAGSLRQVVSVVKDAAVETSQVAEAITAGGEHMAETAQHIAQTSNDLSRRAGDMAGTIDALVADAVRLVAIAAELTEGAHAGVARNAQLRQLAQESGARLVESAGALDTLAADAHSSFQAIEELARASEEIQSFVTLVTKMARQSKLLALNAAMEAARAGEQGQGFAVVASEVRRLAASSAESAERTEALVKGVLERVEESRAASARTAAAVDAVRTATTLGLESFRQVEGAARDAEQWVASIERAATSTSAQVGEMNGRLEALSEGTQRFATAMEEVAAASQEQSASTQEIAAAGQELTRSAERLRGLTESFRVEG